MGLRFNDAGIWEHRCRHCRQKFFPPHNGIYLCSPECRTARLKIQRQAALDRWRARKAGALTNRQRGARNRAKPSASSVMDRMCIHCGKEETTISQLDFCPRRESEPHVFAPPTREAVCEE